MVSYASHRWFGKIGGDQHPNSCFVIMPFSTSWAPTVWQVIQEAFGSEAMNCIRADFMGGHIVLKDIAEGISRCELLIADVTGGNPNVFYEIGISHAWELEVLLLAQKGSLIPFDLTSFRHIIYATDPISLDELRNRLKQYAREKMHGRMTPSNITIDQARSASEPNTRFIGHWEGAWTGSVPGNLPHSLVVKSVNGSKANAVYFWGICPEWRISAGSRRLYAEVVGDTLVMEWPYVHIKYKHLDDSTLAAERVDRDGTFTCLLKRVR